MYAFLKTLLYLVYTITSPVAFYFILKKIYQEKDKNAWHLLYLTKFLATLSFLPILFLKDVDLALIPVRPRSVLYLLVIAILSVYGLKLAIRNRVLQFYVSGVFAAFMEEILFRGVLFGLILSIWHNNLTALIFSSISFGIWHLKNYGWHKNKKYIFRQFLYTGLIYGPVFSLMRILTGDIYLAVLFHYITDAYVALAPEKWRWSIMGDLQKGEGFKDV